MGGRNIGTGICDYSYQVPSPNLKCNTPTMPMGPQALAVLVPVSSPERLR